MSTSANRLRYRGDGSVPEGSTPATRNERGRYLADPQLVSAVNTALVVEQPLLVTGEPGTGKTALAWSVASELGLGDVLEFHTRSDHQASDALFEIGTCRRWAWRRGRVVQHVQSPGRFAAAKKRNDEAR